MITPQPNKCYRFARKVFTHGGLLDRCVDATYIIHLESDIERMNQVTAQLELFQPTRTVYIVYNKGFSNCEKNLHENTPPIDLVDAFITVFKDANEKGFNNILILEDDFIFDERIKNPEVCQSICHFMSNHGNEPFVYLLGCLPMIQLPYSYEHRLAVCKAGTHAAIYSKGAQTQILETDQKQITDWDVYTNMNIRQYMFKDPLCYQLFPQTENQKHWFHVPGFSEIFAVTREALQLDKQIEPGYSFFYSILSHLGVLILLVILMYKFILIL